eukprot:TRINITY_DN75306_c0_g1_i1.p1 TRINITY_DN75306_c0_g1~~TRINITY_DN75306_c0_g1_i1.p1  ORF type:complete len:243 (+),score=32.85 TRINITY_DN75306_c0_g1_i1:105-731(+)
MTARIEKVEVVEQGSENADILNKGLDFLKSRISILGSGQHAVYTIHVTWDGKTHRARKRFSEFAALHDFLKERFPVGLTFDLPAKTAIRTFSQEALDDRKNALNAYLKELCRFTELINCPQVLAFFGILSDRFADGSISGGPVDQGSSRIHGAPSHRTDSIPRVHGAPAQSTGGYGGSPAQAPPPGRASVTTTRAEDDDDDDLFGWDR